MISTANKEEDRANALPFSELCKVFSKVSDESKSEKKLSLIFTDELKRILNGQSPFPVMRLVLPQLDSERHVYGMKHTTVAEFYRKALGLAKDSVDALRMTSWKDPTKHTMARGHHTTSSIVGDLPAIIEDVLKIRIPAACSTKTIGDVNDILDQLCKAADNTVRQAVLSQIKDSFNAEEQKWLMRIIFKDLKIGLKHERVLGYLHRAALDMYNHVADLRRVCEDLIASAGPCYFPEASESAENSSTRPPARDGDDVDPAVSGAVIEVSTSSFQVFRAFSPMLAFKLDDQLEMMEPTMKGLPFVMEIKLDGERMLCHKDGDRIQWFSRRTNDYTQTYGKVMDRIISRFVIADKCILDGEMMAWDDEAKKHVGFGHNKTVAMEEIAWMDARMESAFVPKSSSSSSSSASSSKMVDDDDGAASDKGPRRWLKFIVFDIVYLDGPGADRLISSCASSSLFGVPTDLHRSGSIHNLPLDARKSILTMVIPSIVPQRLEFVKSKVVGVSRPSSSSSSSTGLTAGELDRGYRVEELMSFFDEAVLGHEEGLVIKRLDSKYIPGEQGRRTRAWVKLKPEYSDQTTNLDLIVLGGYYGEGKRRSGAISHFLLGVKDDRGVAGGPIKYTTFCKVGTGYTLEQLATLRNHLKNHMTLWPSTGQPRHFNPWKIGKTSDVPDVWVDPEHSVVFEIKCGEITPSDQFAAGITARFPRVHEIRYDKLPHECLTALEIKDLFERERTTRTSKESSIGLPSARLGIYHDGIKSKKDTKKKNTSSGSSDSSSRIVLSGQHKLIAPQFRTIEVSKVIVISAMFNGLEFCVYDGDFVYAVDVANEIDDDHESEDDGVLHEDDAVEPLQRKRSFKAYTSPRIRRKMVAVERKRYSKHEIEEMIVTHGGQVVASPHDTTWACICPSSETVRVNNIIASGKFDVLKFDWIVECVANGSATPLTFSHFKFITDATREDMRKSLDRFGDHFTVACTIETLKRSFDEANRIRDEADPGKSESQEYKGMVDKLLEEKDNEFDASSFVDRFNNEAASKRRITRSNSFKREKKRMSMNICSTALNVLRSDSVVGDEHYLSFLTCPMSEMPRWSDILTSSVVTSNGSYILCPEDVRECMDTRWTFFWRNNTCVYVDRYFDCGKLPEPGDHAIDDDDTYELFTKNPDGRSILFSSLNPDAAQIALHGGRLASVLHERVTHILVDARSDMSRFSLIRRWDNRN